MIHCNKCNTDKEDDLFRLKNGKREQPCKKCANEYGRTHYSKNKQYYINKANKRNVDIRNDNLQRIWDYFKSHPCVDCGIDNPRVLEFDHKDITHKDADVSALVHRAYSWERIKEEIDKCTVRCANCHRIRTYIQFGFQVFDTLQKPQLEDVISISDIQT